ncbi:MAG: hypothetical protein KJZ69_09530 [Phycisphaerales bacterium]|nr:hypothetical protein [Phycisphaerales bacterium]
MSTLLSNRRIVELVQPFFPSFSSVHQTAMLDTLASVEVMGGLPRRTERANVMHWGLREGMRWLCDKVDEPWLRLVEKPEGDGLDYLVLSFDPSRPLGIRWGRYKCREWGPHRVSGVRRNETDRTGTIQEQGVLWGDIEEGTDGLPMVSIAHTIEGDFTEASRPCWWIGRLVLIRERQGGASEFITEVARFAEPLRIIESEIQPSPRVVAREAERSELERLAENLKRRLA